MAMSISDSNTACRLLDGCRPFRKKWKSLAPPVPNSWEEQNKSGSEAFPACLLNALEALAPSSQAGVASVALWRLQEFLMPRES